MRAKLLMLATAAAFVLPAAAAGGEVDLYGVAHVSLDRVGNGDPDPANKDSAFSVTSNKSRLGLRGRELLGSAFVLHWQIENTVDLDNGGWGPARDSFIGLETRYGTVRAGKYVTPYRIATDRLDVFADTRADYNAVISTVDGEVLFSNRAPNILIYTTPEDKRLRFGLAYVSSMARDDLPVTTAEADQSALSMSLVFDSGPLYVGLARETLSKSASATVTDAEATKLGLGWDFGQGTRLAFIWEDASSGAIVAGKEAKRQAYYLNAAHISGNNTYKVAYGMLDAVDSAADSGATFAALGWYRALSRLTDVYLLVAGTFNDNAGNYGLQPDHDGAATATDPRGSGPILPGATGENASAFSAGVIHRFEVEL